MNGIGQRVRTLRKKKGWTQEEFAEVLGMHVNTVIRWENGTRIPNIPKIKALAGALETTVEYLLGEEDKRAIQTPTEGKLEAKLEGKTEGQTTEGDIPKMIYWAGIVDEARLAAKRGDRSELSAIRTLLELALNTVEDGCLALGMEAKKLPLGGGNQAQKEHGHAV